MMSFRRASLRSRLLWIAMLPAGLLATALAVFFIAQGSRESDNAVRERILAIASFLAPAAEYGVVSGSQQTLDDLLGAAAKQPDVVAAVVFDSQGTPIGAHGEIRLIELDRLRHVRQPTILSSDPERVSVAAPVLSVPILVNDMMMDAYTRLPGSRPPQDTVGWVYLEMDTRAQQAVKHEQIMISLGLTLLSFLVASIIGSRLARSIAQPIGQLAHAVDRVAAGEPQVSVAQRATITELRQLEQGFNAMAQAIDEAHSTLQAKVDEATAKLAHQATHDPLTDLPNRRAFEQALEEAMNASRRDADHSALCIIDLDRFKHVNDTGGHAAGDALLLEVAALLQSRLRRQDLVCRIGGDEFAVILRNCTIEDAEQIAEQVRNAITDLRFAWQNEIFSIGASIGLTTIDGQITSASQLLAEADLACYTAKRGGRNRVVAVLPNPDASAPHNRPNELTS